MTVLELAMCYSYLYTEFIYCESGNGLGLGTRTICIGCFQYLQALFVILSLGFYVQPDVTFLIEQPESQLVLIGSSFSLSCGVELRGLSNEEGGLNVPVVHWLFNHTTITDVCPISQ